MKFLIGLGNFFEAVFACKVYLFVLAFVTKNYVLQFLLGCQDVLVVISFDFGCVSF